MKLERDITVGADDLELPVGKKKALVVILVHGSGPQDRDETVGPNKPFRDLAHGGTWHCNEFRYDKRTERYMVQRVQNSQPYRVQ